MKRLMVLVAIALGCAAIAVALTGSPTTHPAATGSIAPAGWGATPPGYRTPPPLYGLVPTQTMYDSVAAGEIPANPFAAAGYTAGRWPTWATIRKLAKHAVSIAINAGLHADCLDVEPGDAAPAQAGPWARADIKAGFAHPCLYSDLAEMPAVQTSLAASLGARWRSIVFLWLAWYRGIPGLVSGYDAVQYDDHCQGRNLDCSTVSLRFLTIAQPPYVPPKPKPKRTVCFGRNAAPRSSACKPIVAKVASDERAAAASLAALSGAHQSLLQHACQIPYRRGVCVQAARSEGVFAQRISYFTTTAQALEKEYHS